MSRHQQGFTLIELMIALTLGLVISAAVIQVMISNNATERLNRALAATQENGRFVVSRLRQELLMTGRYDPLSADLNTDVDIAIESAFVVNSPVPLPGDFIAAPAKGAIDGANGASDTLMVALQAFEDCRGLKHGYGTDEEFFVVNEYFLDGTSLMCRGFDGRVLRGQKVATGNDADKAYVILDDVYSFQVVYGVTEGFSTTDNSARPVQFIPANELAVAEAAGSQVVAIRIAVLLKGDSDLIIDSPMQFKLLNEYAITPSEKRLFKQFETTITLRNSKNTIRSRNI